MQLVVYRSVTARRAYGTLILDMKRPATIDPNAVLTPNKTAEALYELSGNRCAPSAKRIRKAITRPAPDGLRARREGRWVWIRWGDALDYFRGEFAVDPDEEREERARRNVDEQIRSENELVGGSQ